MQTDNEPREGANNADASKKTGQVFEEFSSEGCVDQNLCTKEHLGRDCCPPVHKLFFTRNAVVLGVKRFNVFTPDMLEGLHIHELVEDNIWVDNRFVLVSLLLECSNPFFYVIYFR